MEFFQVSLKACSIPPGASLPCSYRAVGVTGTCFIDSKVLRWDVSHSAEVNENINLGYSQDQGYS